MNDNAGKMIRKRRFSGRGRMLRRLTSVLLVLAMLFQLLPGSAKKAEAASASTEKELGKFSKVGSGTNAGSNTYILEISSGTKSGGGAAENVLYFAVYYTTTDGMKRTAILCPTVDALTNSLTEAKNAGSRSSRESLVKDTFGYRNQSFTERKALGSAQTDQLIFKSQGTVRSFDKIQVFGKKTASESTWTCQGMRIHKVNTLYGLDMAGWFSNSYFIDFAGEVVAEAVIQDGGGIFRWNNSGGCKTITGLSDRSGGISDMILVNKNETEKFQSMYPRMKHHLGLQHKSQADNTIVLRLDLADQAGAGLEALAGSYQAGSRSKISSLKFCESAAITIRYTDLYGVVRQLSLPLVLNALGQVVETLDDVAIAGFAQQGDSIAIPLMLPDFVDLNYIGLTLGEAEARAATGIVLTDTGSTIRNDRIKRSETDDINYTCFAIYRDVKATVSMDANGATLQYRFVPGAKNPVQYSTSTSIRGLNIPTKSLKYITLQNYNQNMALEPVDRQERYLITAYTDDVLNAGTAGDILLQFHYISLKDKELVSDPYSVREYVQQFYGEWAGNVSEFAYKYGFSQGSAVQFMIPLEGVREFTGVSIKVEGDDEWQVSGMSIAMVNSYEGRTAVWEEINSKETLAANPKVSKLSSHLRYSREVDTDPICFTLGAVPDPEHPLMPGDPGWEPGTLIQDDGEWTVIDGEGGDVTTKEDVDWSELSHYMTYEDTQQDLGFTKKRAEYTVTVKVAGEKTATGADHNPIDDDCGSANLFYFQLIFENGSSGVTLANQQIVGDAFRTGTEVSFKISTSQDYGDLVSIVVIPDDQDGNSNIYDKLKIEYILVSKESNAALTPSWAARGDAKDGLGWVGIEYRDPGEASNKMGVEGRTLSEIATTYQITESGYSAKLMVSITTGAYGQTTRYDYQGNGETVIDPAFTGGVSLSYSYFNREGRFRTVEGIDIIKAMYEYMGRPGSTVRTYQDGTQTVTEEVDFYVSDPNYQFRPSKADCFFLTVDDIWQILDMTLVIRSSVVTRWNITNVSVYLVKSGGKRVINANGEYDFVYNKGEEPIQVAVWDRAEDQILSKDVQTYRTLQDNSIAELNISFKENEVPLDKASTAWASVVPKEPNSKNDTLNLYLYPETGSSAASPDDYELLSAIRYTDVTNKIPMQSSTGELIQTKDDQGRTVFYATGITANNMDSLAGVDVLASSRKTVTVPIRYGILQRVRSGVLIETYLLTGLSNAALGGTLHATNRTEASSTQRVFLQAPLTQPEQKLTADDRDLAVAVYFKPDYPDSQELRSKYIYLTDEGYDSFTAGSLVELHFDLGEVKEITGINIVKIGNPDLEIEHLYVADQAPDGTALLEWRAQSGVVPVRTPTKVRESGWVDLFTMVLETAADEASASSGTEGPIRMTIGYYDLYGVSRTKTYDDIRPYIRDGESFKAGGRDVIQLLVPGLAQARWVQLEPWSETGDSDTLASWKLDKLTASTGVEGREVVRTVDTRIVEDSPVKVFLTDVILVGNVNVLTPQPNGKDPTSESRGTAVTGETKSVAMDSGQQLEIAVRVSGSDEGVGADISAVDPETGELVPAKLDAVADYDTEKISKIRQQAEKSYKSDKASKEEKEAAKKVMDQIDAMKNADGDFKISKDKKTVTFVPPRNFSSSNQKYLIYIYSLENSESILMVEVIVHTEESGLNNAIEEWNNVRSVGEVKVLDEDDKTVSTETMTRNEKLSLALESGEKLEITPRLTGKAGITTKLVSIDPDTGDEGKVSHSATHGYTDKYLSDLYKEAKASAESSESSNAEKEAAKELMKVISAMQNGAGSFSKDSSTNVISFTPARNYTGTKMKYRLYVESDESGDEKDVSFIVEITVRSENDRLQSAIDSWNLVRTAGNVKVLNTSGSVEETITLLKNDSRSLMLESGEGLQIIPRTSLYPNFTAAITGYDPSTGATGRAKLEATHGYSESQLNAREAYANETLAIEGVTDAERAAARKVLSIIAAMRDSEGSFSNSSSPVKFKAPRNYGDSKLYYQITVKDSSGELIFSLIVTVETEKDPLPDAYSALQEARLQGDEERAAAATTEEPTTEEPTTEEPTTEEPTTEEETTEEPTEEPTEATTEEPTEESTEESTEETTEASGEP